MFGKSQIPLVKMKSVLKIAQILVGKDKVIADCPRIRRILVAPPHVGHFVP